MSIVIFDTETTGLALPMCADIDLQPRIIEIGAIKLDSEFNVIDTMSRLINPEIEIPTKITKITGISNTSVKNSPTFSQFYDFLKNFFKDVNTLICHNVSFDLSVLNSEIIRIGFDKNHFILPKNLFCTVLEFQHIFGGYVKLKDMYKHFLGVELSQTHRALDDCQALYDILKCQKSNVLRSI